MAWYEKLLDTAKDVAPTVAGGAAMALSGGNPALDSGALTLRGSLEDPVDMIMRLLARSNRINEIVAEGCLPRRDGGAPGAIDDLFVLAATK